tara:strand:- start:1656 stop:2150 length:495 start_codon:yes stop_codon:yes gene_type:complete
MNREKKKMNNQGKLLSIWWFFVLTVIGAGIVIGVVIYYSADLNVKEVEASILAERVMDCIVDNGQLKEVVLDKELIFEECYLDKKVFGEASNFYFEVFINEESIVQVGDASFEKDCEIERKVRTYNFPKCAEKSQIVLNNNNERVNLLVLAGSNQKEKKGVVNV